MFIAGFVRSELFRLDYMVVCNFGLSGVTVVCYLLCVLCLCLLFNSVVVIKMRIVFYLI